MSVHGPRWYESYRNDKVNTILYWIASIVNSIVKLSNIITLLFKIF